MPPRRSSSRQAKKPKPRAQWVWAPATVAPGETMRREVEARAQELIDTVFKPKHVRAALEHPSWNYIADIVGRWHRGFFTSCRSTPVRGRMRFTYVRSALHAAAACGGRHLRSGVHAAHRTVVGALPQADAGRGVQTHPRADAFLARVVTGVSGIVRKNFPEPGNRRKC